MILLQMSMNETTNSRVDMGLSTERPWLQAFYYLMCIKLLFGLADHI